MSECLKKKVESVLLKVQKPARYVGGELYQVVKNPVCLLFSGYL